MSILTIDDLTHIQRAYLRFLARAAEPSPRKPASARKPSAASLSVLFELKLISPTNAGKPFMGLPRPLHLVDWRITQKGLDLVRAADAADISIETRGMTNAG